MQSFYFNKTKTLFALAVLSSPLSRSSIQCCHPLRINTQLHWWIDKFVNNWISIQGWNSATKTLKQAFVRIVLRPNIFPIGWQRSNRRTHAKFHSDVYFRFGLRLLEVKRRSINVTLRGETEVLIAPIKTGCRCLCLMDSGIVRFNMEL